MLAKAREIVGGQDERWWSAEVSRLEGDLTRMQGGTQEEVQRCYLSALETAREQQAKSWELRAATSLARFWSDQGKRLEARDLLAPVCGWFTEGFDTPDVKHAKALLEELAT